MQGNFVCIWFSADFVPKKETVSFAVEKGHQGSADPVTSSPSRGRLKGRSRVSDGKDVPHSATSSPCKNPRKFGTETDPQSARRGSLTLGLQDAARSSPRAGEFCSSKTWQRLDHTADEFGTKSREAVQSKQAAAEQRNLNRSKPHSRSRESNFGADVDGDGISYGTKMVSNDANLDTDDSANVAFWPSWPERIASDYSLGSSEPCGRHGDLERDCDSDNGNQLCGSLGKIDLDNGPLKSRSRPRKFKRAGSFGNTLDGSPSKKAETGLPLEEVINQACAVCIYLDFVVAFPQNFAK